jgi:myo-inositol-1(or 4)-monophosphatase
VNDLSGPQLTPPPATADAERFLEVALELARLAGQQIMADLPLGLWRGEGIEHKDSRELVSRVDRASERLIVGGLREAFPDHAIVGEEGGYAEGAGVEAEWRWLVDPLDGTTNFLHGHPFFCISIGLEHWHPPGPAGQADARPGPEMLAAVVRAPYLDETYFALRGAGAFLNSRSLRLAVSPTGELAEALVCTGFAYDRARFPNYGNFARIAEQSLGIHRCGSAALDLSFVAAGRYDAFWELGLRPHDVAAGALLVQEAGGRVTDFAAGGDWLEGRNVVASNGHLHEAIRALLDPWQSS